MKTTLSILLLLCFFAGSAQVNPLEQGIVTTKSGAVIRGNVYWESEHHLASSFKLITDNGNTEKVFKPEDVTSLLLLNDSLVYEPVTFSRTVNEQKVTQKSLARLITRSNLSLYRLELDAMQYDIKDGYSYVFIIRKNNQDYTLMHSPNTWVKGYDKYKEMLRYLTRDASIKENQIRNTGYNEKSLTDLISIYASKTDHTPVEKHAVKSNSILLHQIKLGGMYSPTSKYNDMSIKNGTGYSIGYALDVMTPRLSKRYYTTVEVAYFHQQWPTYSYIDFYGTEKSLDLVRNGGRVSIIGNYKFTYTKVVPLLHFGIVAEYTKQDKIIPYVSLGAGVKADRFTLSAHYEQPLVFFVGETSPRFFHLKLGIGFLQSPKTKS
jgi:hypothetical protein